MYKNYFSKKINALILCIVMAMFFSACQKTPVQNQEQNQVINQEQQNQTASSSTDEIDTSDWLTYRNEEYGFELKYPEGWYWEDYSKDFKALELKVGFYPSDKSKGWEYVGDIQVAIHNNNILNIDDYYEKYGYYKKSNSEKVKKIITKNNYKSIIEYDVPGMIEADTAMIICNNYIFYIDTPYAIARKEMIAMVNEFLCF